MPDSKTARLNTENAKSIQATLFKAVFTERLPKKFIDNYIYGNGKSYNLNKSDHYFLFSDPKNFADHYFIRNY